MDLNFKDKVYKALRKLHIKDLTNHLGEIIEEDDKFICLINQKKLDLFYSEKKSKVLTLNGFNINNKENIDLKFNKPIYYIFDGIFFNNKLKLSSIFDPFIIFRNCDFLKNINILYGGTIIFENNKYISNTDDMCFDDNYLDIHKAKNIIFQNDKFTNDNRKKEDNKFNLNINADNISIIESDIDIMDKYDCYLKTKKLLIKDSFVRTGNLYIDSFDIDMDKSSIVTTNMVINNQTDKKLDNIYANKIIYNNIILKDANQNNSLNEAINIDYNFIKRQELKNNLLNILKKIKNECEKNKQQELLKKENELNSTKIVKFIKK